MIRHLDRYDPASKRQEPVSCTVCGGPTWHSKPWCSDHVDQSPYVRRLLERLGHEYGGPETLEEPHAAGRERCPRWPLADEVDVA